jgi:hypothetical protein
LDFLGPWPFCSESPCFLVLDFLGFPWNLSSETRLINGLWGIFAEKFFLAVYARGSHGGDANHRSLEGEGAELFIGELNAISVFSQ